MEYGFLALTGDAVTIELEDGPTLFTHAGSKTPGDHGHWLWLLLSND